ncbi:MAG TPA: class I SAM-dependent methyltransferase [Stellaceae bacterium]|nr:class I SAM-dependent methyltransferase [Stellaceae bacterium]
MTAEATLRMDRMYRYQRHIYDLSRKFYLLGRDRLVRGLQPGPGARICEIGCGTGRNLVALARRYPDAEIFGIDASNEMLKTANATIARAGLAGRIRIERCLADELDPRATFGLSESFDAIAFSYTLSMIPDWGGAVDRAVSALKPAGLLAVVDFSEQRGLPEWFRNLLRRWLTLFEVTPRAALPAYLQALAERERGGLTVEPLYRDYACLMRYRRPAAL